MHNPIISIIVLVYNSAEFLKDSLSSILSQQYYNIDLIITDDCSTDNSLSIVKEWVNINGDYILNVSIVESEVNTGVSANCNRGAKWAKGEWIKFLAADDMLLPNYIHDCLEFISQTTVVAFHSGVNFFRQTFVTENKVKEYNPISHIINMKQIAAHDQYRLLLRDNRIIPTTFIIKKDVFDNIGGCDEDISHIDDWQLFIKITKAGYKIDYLSKVTANYRVRLNSIFDQSIYRRSLGGYGASERMVMKRYVIENIPAIEKAFYFFEFARMKLVQKYSLIGKVVLSLITYYVTTPIWWFYRRVYVRIFYLFQKYCCK